MTAPSRLAHYVLRTNRLELLSRWYCDVLDAHVVFTNGKLSFLTYDEEHHRLALVASEKYAERSAEVQVGFYHAAFAFDNLGLLLNNYERIKACGILPYRCINHGPTLSFYYRDPDRNEVEMQVDSFPDAAMTNAWMQSAAFARNPIGILLDVDELISKHRSGVPDAVLLRRADMEDPAAK